MEPVLIVLSSGKSTIIGKLSLFTTEQMAAKKRFAEIDTELKRSGAIIDIGRLEEIRPQGRRVVGGEVGTLLARPLE